MRCSVLSIPSAKNRLERTSLELAKCCPTWKWSVPKMCVAIEWTENEYECLYDEERGRRYLPFPRKRLSAGEIACVLSHQSAMHEFLAAREQSLLILEDDVRLSLGTGAFLEQLEVWLAKIGDRPVCVLLTNPVWARRITARRWVGGYKRIRPLEAYGGVAYVLNRAGAELMLRVNHIPIVTTSDNWSFYSSKGLKVYSVDPPLAGTYDIDRSDSSLSAGRAETVGGRASGLNRVLVGLKRRAVRFYYMLTFVKYWGGVSHV